jgi:hypothetical protein
VTTTTKPPVPRINPFTVPAVVRYLHSRAGNITAGVYDVDSNTTYLYRPGLDQRTASMVKIDILATLLYQAQRAHRSLTAVERDVATGMITESDNDDATTLFNEIGQAPGLTAFNKLIGYTQTTVNYAWGLTQTNPRDELKLLRIITLPNKILTPASRAYEQDLMQHVVSYERFGLGWGSPARAVVGMKNGWYPESDTGWQVNTSGYVKYHGRFYMVTIMTTSEPGEAYGISTLTTLSSLIYRCLRP